MRLPHRLIGLTLAVMSVGAALPAGAHALTSPETMWLDTSSTLAASRVGFSGPATTFQPLTAGQYYVAEATGTFSRYLPELMRNARALGTRRCGTPEAAPMFPSPGKADTKVGIDPEWAFSYVVANTGPGACPVPAVRPIGAFQINTGDGYRRIVASNRGVAPRPDHRYTYLVEGAGRPVAFRYLDAPLRDNNGVIRIVVRPATPADCGADAVCLERTTAGAPPAGAAGDPGAADGQTTTSAAQTAGNPVIATPSARCVSRRVFRIRLVDRARDPIVAATVRVNGKTVKVVRARSGGRSRTVSTIDLRGLPDTRVTVSITARTASGTTLRGARKYFTCKVKRQSGPPKL